MNCSVAVAGESELVEIALEADEVKRRLYLVHDDPTAILDLPLADGGVASIRVAGLGLIIPHEED